MLLQGPLWGSGGGQVVSMLAFSSDDLSSNPAGVKSYSIKFVFEKKENNQKEAGDDQFKKYFSKNHNPLQRLKISSIDNLKCTDKITNGVTHSNSVDDIEQ